MGAGTARRGGTVRSGAQAALAQAEYEAAGVIVDADGRDPALPVPILAAFFYMHTGAPEHGQGTLHIPGLHADGTQRLRAACRQAPLIITAPAPGGDSGVRLRSGGHGAASAPGLG